MLAEKDLQDIVDMDKVSINENLEAITRDINIMIENNIKLLDGVSMFNESSNLFDRLKVELNKQQIELMCLKGDIRKQSNFLNKLYSHEDRIFELEIASKAHRKEIDDLKVRVEKLETVRA